MPRLPGGPALARRRWSARAARARRSRGSPSGNQFDCDVMPLPVLGHGGDDFHDSHLPLWKWFLAVYLDRSSPRRGSARSSCSGPSASPTRPRGTSRTGSETQWARSRTPPLVGAGRSGRDPISAASAAVRAAAPREQDRGDRRGPARRPYPAAAHPNTRNQRHRGSSTSPCRRPRSDLHRRAALLQRFATHEDPATRRSITGPTSTCAETFTRTPWSACGASSSGRSSATTTSSRVKHLPAYLDEMEWRFNNRDNPYLFRDTLLVLLARRPAPLQGAGRQARGRAGRQQAPADQAAGP